MKRFVSSLHALFVLSLACSASAQDYERIAPKLPPTANPAPGVPTENEPPKLSTDEDAVIVQNVRAVRLLSSTGEVQHKNLKQFSGVTISPSVDLLAKESRFSAELQSAFVDHSLTKRKLEMLRREIISHYRDHDRPVVTVSVPPQDVTDGVLQLVVTEARVSAVRVEGNKYFKSERIAGQVRLQEGEPIRSDRLMADVALLNENPFRSVDVVYEPGVNPGTTDVILRTTDQRPYRFYIGYDDAGVEETGRNRLMAGFNWGDAFFTDGLLSYQHTTSTDFKALEADSLQYTAVLPWKHVATLFGSYGHVDADLGDARLRNTGENWQIGLRYSVPLYPQFGNFTHSLVYGFDYKRTNNNLAFGGESVAKSNVDVGQFMAGYNASFNTASSRTTLNLETYYNPGDWIGHDSKADYRQLRAEASDSYVYAKATFAHTQRLPKNFTASLSVTGQVASGNLVPSEQFGLGGYSSVRGYDERVVNADNALLINAEVRTPPVSIGQALGWKKANDQLQFLAFLDYGVGANRHLLPDEPSSTSLLSVGPGLRYSIGQYVSFRLDYGFQLKDIGADDHGRVHIGVTVSY